MADAGIEWVTVNIGDGHTWDDWRVVITRARALGVGVFPWKRCRTLSDCYDLLDDAETVGFRAILNIEDEFESATPPERVAEIIADFPTLDVGISTVGWVYNAVDFRPLTMVPALLQLFPTDMRRDPADLQQIQRDCVTHARDGGFTYVGVTFQTYANAEPDWYAYHEGTRSFYTGDDIGAGNWAAWA